MLHEREASCNFACYLGDGEPLDHVSHYVPKGRGPFKTFEDGAIDALVHEGFDKVKDWTLGSVLFHAEEFNGEGYHDHGLPSPYVFAGSNQYSHGKFDRDGHFNADLVDTQPGCAVMLQALIQLNILTL
jgi:lysozyme family protein